MKCVVSVSLGSSTRNHSAHVTVGTQKFSIERLGTDGSIEKAIDLIKQLDGKVDAIGLGGTDRYLYTPNRRYEILEAKRIANAALVTPVLDGSGLKNSLERKVISQLVQRGKVKVANKNVLLVSGVDRFGMAQEFVEQGANMIFGDLIFGLGLPIPLRTMTELSRAASLIVPIICRLPIKYVYPTGQKQEQVGEKYAHYYEWADIIAGDFLFIKKYLCRDLSGKVIITNTVTQDDIALLQDRGLHLLVTTTPELEGRSFGTNVMEALLVAYAGRQEALTAEKYLQLIDEVRIEPRILEFNQGKKGGSLSYA